MWNQNWSKIHSKDKRPEDIGNCHSWLNCSDGKCVTLMVTAGQCKVDGRCENLMVQRATAKKNRMHLPPFKLVGPWPQRLWIWSKLVVQLQSSMGDNHYCSGKKAFPEYGMWCNAALTNANVMKLPNGIFGSECLSIFLDWVYQALCWLIALICSWNAPKCPATQITEGEAQGTAFSQ